MAQDGVAVGIPTDLSTTPPVCQHCILGKQTKQVVPKLQQGERAQGILDIIYSDLTSPEDMTSAGGAKYILNFVDNMSRMTWTYLIKEKSQAEKVFVEWLALVQNETGRQAKCFRTDNGGEFTSKQFESYLRQQGIQHQVTAPYTSVQNGCAECTHRTIMDRARSIRSDLNLPANLWGECVLTSTYMKNRTLSRSLKGCTPFEAYYGKKPDLTHLQELGCRAFVLKQGVNPKIYCWSVECILIGYSPNLKAYQCYHCESQRIHTSWDGCFIESQDGMPTPTIPDEIDTDDAPEEEDEDNAAMRSKN